MKRAFAIILILMAFLAFGQERDPDMVDKKVYSIESDTALKLTEFDWAQLTGITTDSDGILKVWRNGTQICKIYEEVGLSYGRISTTIYPENEIPIKVLETEENFGHKNGETDYNGLDEVFRVIIYVFDWENDDSRIRRIGKRIMSEGNCLVTFKYEPILKRAKKVPME